MRLHRTIALRDNGYEAYIDVHEDGGLDSHEVEVFTAHGEPVVECGGHVVDKHLDVIIKTHPDPRAFPSQFPLRRLFPFTDPRANDNAIAFLRVVSTRLVAARDAMLTRYPTTINADVMDI